jgi:hypothetical protein
MTEIEPKRRIAGRYAHKGGGGGASVSDSSPHPRARPGVGDTINWGIFNRHFWGELLQPLAPPLPYLAKGGLDFARKRTPIA